jgi:hypothetical protein
MEINNGVSSDGKIKLAASQLTNGRTAGASGMRAEHVKAWLFGIWDEENPETSANAVAGDNWHLFTQLVQSAWTHGNIPCQLLWIIVVLIPKGGGDFRGIGLLEPIWKVLEQIMDLKLDFIDLHKSLHGCCGKRRTGTAVIEAKLAQEALVPQAVALVWCLS